MADSKQDIQVQVEQLLTAERRKLNSEFETLKASLQGQYEAQISEGQAAAKRLSEAQSDIEVLKGQLQAAKVDSDITKVATQGILENIDSVEHGNSSKRLASIINQYSSDIRGRIDIEKTRYEDGTLWGGTVSITPMLDAPKWLRRAGFASTTKAFPTGGSTGSGGAMGAMTELESRNKVLELTYRGASDSEIQREKKRHEQMFPPTKTRYS